MKIRCKCGSSFAVPKEALASAEPRVTCPQCQTRYRLRRPGAPTDPTASRSIPGSITAPSEPPATGRTAPQDAHLGGEEQKAGQGDASSPPAFQTGDLVAGRYRIERFLARGGMGEVYAAEDVELQERVALKTIAGRRDPARIDRFKREISLARRVTHPNVCRIFDLGQHTGADGEAVTFLTMELLQGETLAEFLRVRRRLGTGLALPIARQIGAALDAAHQAEVVHRDLKPENVFLVQSGVAVRTVVTDFGIARAERADPFAARVTGTKIVGTPAYMAPEQVAGDPVGPAADVYAFGVVLYEMVTGRLPFESDNPLSVAAKRLQDAPTPPTFHVADLDPAWERVILRCLARRPEDRFSSCAEALAGLEPSAADTVPPSPVPGTAHTRLGGARGAADPSGGTLRATAETATSVSPGRGGGGALAPSSTTRATRPLLVVLALVALAAVALSVYNRWRDRSPAHPPRRSVAVLGFHNLSGQQEQAWMATALSEMIGTELARGERLRAVPRDQVARMRQELGLDDVSALGELSAEQMRRIHAVLGCDFLVTGTYLAAPQQTRVDLRLADAPAGTVLASFAHEGDESELFDVVRALGDDVRERLGVGAGRGPDPLAGLPSSRQAARLYSEALDAMQRFEPRTARDALVEAARIEPDNPMIRLALSTAWKALGNDQRASREAERALELSSDLSQEDRLVIRGHHQEMLGSWAAAADVYRQLWESFPGNLEHGLRLTAAQAAAGRPAEALASIAQLRELPPPASEDPRLDLAEAEAAAVAADYERQLAAARRGAGRAEDLGASLLAAQARVAESQASRFLGRTQEAIAAALDGLDIYRQLERPTGSALALLALANAHHDLGELDQAAARSEEAIALYREIGDDAGLASALNSLALTLKKQGEVDRAQQLYREAQQIFESTGDRLGLANAINNQATVLILTDDLDQARAMLERAREIWTAADDASGRAFVLNNIGVVERLRGDLEASRAAHREALDIRRRLGQKLGEVFSLGNLGGTLTDLGELAAAGELLGQCRTLADAMGHRSAHGSCLHKLAEVRLAQGRLDEAATLHEEALALRETLRETTTVAESHAALARLRLERGAPAEAEQDAQLAVDGFRAEGRRAEEGLAAALLARARWEQGRRGEARATLAEAVALGGDSRQLAIRFRIALTDALIGRSPAEALEPLTALEREADDAGFALLALEAQLERLLLAGDDQALRELQAEAATADAGWIVSRIESALSS